MIRNMIRTLGVAAVIVGASLSTVAAQSAADFYKGKTVTIYIGYGVGGTYGKSATIMGEHLKPRIGANAVIVQSMSGAGGLKMTNYFYNVAPKDGTAIILPPDSLVITQLTKPGKAKYKSDMFTWLGAVVRANSFMAIRADSGIKSWKDMRNKEVPFASSGVGSQTFQIPSLVNALLGTKIKIVRGYRGSRKMLLAMEQGEVAGITLSWLAFKTNRQEWFQNGFAVPILQMGPAREADHPDLPLLSELVKPEDLSLVSFLSTLVTIGRSLAVPPGTPADRTEFLKTAFVDMAKDPRFVADMMKRKLDVTYTPAEEIQKVVSDSLKLPAATIERAKQILSPEAS